MVAVLSSALTCAPSDASEEAAVDRFLAAYNARDLAGLRASFAPDAVFRTVLEGEVREESPSAVINRYRDVVFRRFPSARLHVVERLRTAGGRIAQVEGVSGFEDNSETGVAVYTVRDGCITALDVYS
jgi:hypothetical protein